MGSVTASVGETLSSFNIFSFEGSDGLSWLELAIAFIVILILLLVLL
jgi:hypothetical protein